LLHAFYDIRSERQLMEQLHYNLLYRWFVGLGVDDPVWVPTRVLTQFCFDDKPLRFSVMTLPVYPYKRALPLCPCPSWKALPRGPSMRGSRYADG
jgi:Transposase domain (DUF772)